MGVSLNGGFSPHVTPQVMIFFSRKTNLFVGVSPTFLGNPQILQIFHNLLDIFWHQLKNAKFGPLKKT